MKKISYKILVTVLSGLLVWHVPLFADSATSKDKSVKFSWESIDWAIRYKVEIKDVNDKTVLERELDTNSIEFTLPPGKYRIRVGAVNKFEKFSGWSDWAETEIVEKRVHDTMALNLGINVSVGVPYATFLSSWDSPFENSRKGFIGKITFNFGNFILMKPSDTIRYRGLLSYFGLELDGSYMDYPGRNVPGKVKIGKKEIAAGGSLCFRTNFDLPVNFLVRGGGGIAESRFTYNTLNFINQNLEAVSRDPYYKIGASLEVNVFRDFIVEGGADYMVITYLGSPLKSIRYFLMAGIRL